MKADFDRLGGEGKITSESQAIMNSLFMIVELILAIFLERGTQKNNGNSSKPSSQTAKDESALSHSGSNGKGKGENRNQAKNTRVKETVTIAQVHTCDVCAQDLSDVPCMAHERRTKIDIVFEKVIDHVDAEIKRCPACHATVKGLFPSDRHGPLQYGDGLKAFVINLLVGQIVALNRVQKLVKSMIGVVIAEASLLKFVLRLHQALENWEYQATEKLLNMPAINVDETSFRVDMKNHWIHVYSSGDITLKFLHRNRGKAAIEAHTSFHATGVPLFTTAGHLICRTMTAITGCVVRICCAN
ncbi:IS66 family transposase [Nitrosomonas sp. ANs5]|uniref:IS66 family transposase n=1 Tax=Nitrosomonas sp. ANs5 TaxID=3423941 RepID=UPI003D34FB7A